MVEEPVVEETATGEFEVQLTPDGAPDDAALASMAISKTFHGGLEGTSTGRMLAVHTPVKGSAGYVAVERVRARLGGRNGSFALQHSGTMTRGEPSLSITVVPDSGTEELAGLAGAMTIRIENGRHFYSFRYTLPQ